MKERSHQKGIPEVQGAMNLTIPPDIVRHFKKVTGAETKEELQTVFRFILALGERTIDKIWRNNEGQIIYRFGGTEEVIYDGYTKTFGDSKPENEGPDEESGSS